MLDIEGTIAPIDFVYQVLFPYARLRMAEYLKTQLEPVDRNLIYNEYEMDSTPEKPEWADPPLAYVLWLSDLDRKCRGLKSVQGKIWERGYIDGSIKGSLFPDVAPALRRWKEAGRRSYIYSSGSVMAQRMLFRHSVDGDLTSLIDGYFDTEVGPKRAPASYQAISAAIQAAPSQSLFISDSSVECAAASDAGFQAWLAVRPGNQPQESYWPIINTFDDLARLCSTEI